MVIPSAIRSQETKLESDQDHSIKAIIVKRHLKENQERIVSPNNDRQEQIRGGNVKHDRNLLSGQTKLFYSHPYKK